MSADGEPRLRVVTSNGVRLHLAEAGPDDGPLLILLHGFPEFWYGWRHLIGPLAAAGYHVIVPDQRGYNLSDKPARISAYRLALLAGDVIGLADHFHAERVFLAGHDWGAIVAWWVAQTHPERIARTVTLSAGHPAVWRWQMRHDPAQRQLSRYVRIFQLPWLPELAIRGRDFKLGRDAICDGAAPGTITTDDLQRYRTAWSQKGALRGALNWYRALWRETLAPPASYRVHPPMLMLWGEQDKYGTQRIGEESIRLCTDGRLEIIAGANHWLLRDVPAEVVAHMRAFFGH
jgi:pimeloyl-ACP methyl ester carboxylesterase